MKGASTAFWLVVLLVATFSIAAGFVGGRTVVAAGALQATIPLVLPPPVPMRPAKLTRVLTGAHSLDAADDVDPYGDPTLGVTDHAWPPGSFDRNAQRARIAILVVDASRAGPDVDLFLNSALPYTLVVAPGDDDADATSAAARNAGKDVLVDASAATPAQVAPLARDANGVLASLGTHAARTLVHVLAPDALIVDAGLSEDDGVPGAVAKGRTVLYRDVIADARDAGPYVDFMLRDALAIAERHGTAIVLVHARSDTFNALKRFADRARRDGADIVSISALAS